MVIKEKGKVEGALLGKVYQWEMHSVYNFYNSQPAEDFWKSEYRDYEDLCTYRIYRLDDRTHVLLRQVSIGLAVSDIDNITTPMYTLYYYQWLGVYATASLATQAYAMDYGFNNTTTGK